MSFQKMALGQDTPGLMDRILTALSTMMEEQAPVDVIEFCENPDYLGQTLYPRQKLLLKLFYKLELTDAELADVRYLLSRQNKYAQLFFPGLSQSDAYTLPDELLRGRLADHSAYILEVIAGRRGSKSVLGAFVNAYSLYTLLREHNPQRSWGLIPGQEIGTANVATDESQALGLFNQMKGVIEESPWFQKLKSRPLESTLEFIGRAVIARSLHSNSSSIRGKTLAAIFMDEYWHFNKTAGKLSDKAMWAALEPSILTFHKEGKVWGKIVITTSPLNKAGKSWELMDDAIQGKTQAVICAQLATWEMNPTVPRDHEVIVEAYRMDPEYAEMEFGAQVAEQVGYYMPPEAVDACVTKTLSRQRRGQKGLRYCLHVDLSKRRDSTGLFLCHYDKESQRVRTDLVEGFDPQEYGSRFVNAQREIDLDEIYDYIVELEEAGFRFQSITFDQFNSLGLIQRLRRRYTNQDPTKGGTLVEELNINDKSNREMYGSLRSAIVQGAIEFYPHTDLVRQLKQLSRTVKPSGAFKVEAPPGERDDLADAAAAAHWQCLQLALGRSVGFHVVELNDHVVKSAPLSLPNETDEEHHPDCTAAYCHYACPVAMARINKRSA